MVNHSIFVYLNDILIFSKNLEEHIVHVRQVLQRLWEDKLFVKQEKCEFHVPSVTFLGYILESGKVRPDPAKVLAVTEWPQPNTRKQLQRFLGFANFYRRFVRNYSQVVAPLTKLTSPSVPFVWSSAAEEAFCELKRCFSSARILVQPDLFRQFIVEVDASDLAVGAVLSQRAKEDDKLHPCAFFSRKLLPAFKLAREEWCHWLEGAENPITVWTDHT